MKYVPVLLSLCLLLCGCAQRQNGIVNVSSLTPPSETARTPELYLPDSSLEMQTNGAVKAFSPGTDQAYGILGMGENILVLSGTDTTTLTLLEGSNPRVLTSETLDLYLSTEDPSLSVTENGICFYDASARQIWILDELLNLTDILPVPGQLTGSPVLSPDRRTVYYCTVSGICAWDLRSNIHRTLKEIPFGQYSLAGLYRNGAVLQCRTPEGENLFLSTQNGRLLHTFPGEILLSGKGERFFADIPGTGSRQLLFGDRKESVHALFPPNRIASCAFWDTAHTAVTTGIPENGQVPLEVYDLGSGLCRASLILKEAQTPIALTGTSDDVLWLLSYDPEYGNPVLFRWEYTLQPAKDRQVYTKPYYSRSQPDTAGLADCQDYADSLSEKYGIRVRIWKDAAARQPWDYRLEPEHQAARIRQELQNLDLWLSRYPAHMIRDSAAHFSSLSVCIVRGISALSSSSGPENPAGIHFLDGTDAYVVLSVGEHAEGSLYHELFHVMETHIWGNSIAFDQWNSVNPSGFHYDYSYAANAERNSGVYLRDDSRAFVDTYAMSYPKEDRARIMEYAMLPGNRDLFRTPVMQQKLKLLCAGIREAYRLEDWEEPFLWEQYLE